MLPRVDLVSSNVSEERVTSFRMARIGDIGKTLTVTSKMIKLFLVHYFHPEYVGDTFLRNVSSYKSYMA
jgi:hypothetical protein